MADHDTPPAKDAPIAVSVPAASPAPSTACRTEWWHWSYVIDYVATVAVGLVVYFPLVAAQPYCRAFDPLDPAINFPYVANEEFPNYSVQLVAGGAPFIYGLVFLGYLHWRRPAHIVRASLAHQIHSLFWAVLQGLVLATVITNPFKQYMGRHRPDFVARLESELGFDKHAYNMSDPASVSEMVGLVCNSTSRYIYEGMRSFPSGHASYSFAGWTVVGLYMVSVVPWRMPGQPNMPKILLALTPTILPAIVAGSRTRDNRHNYDDILAGSVMGIFTGILGYLLHYKWGSPEPYNRVSGFNASPYHELDDDDAEGQLSPPQQQQQQQQATEPYAGAP